MSRGRIRWSVVAAVLAGCAGTSSSASNADRADEDEPPVGSACTVQFRRDLLGNSRASGPLVNEGTAVSGTLKSVGSEWLVLRVDGDDVWISRDSILLLKIQAASPRVDTR